MRHQYDAIGEHYVSVKQTPLPAYTEIPSVRRVLGNLVGKAVLDLACGTGFYSRLMKELGADRVVGVDVSHAMIAAARKQEESCPQGIEYMIADAADLPRLGRFDLVTAMYLFNYAGSEDMLAQMCRTIAAPLGSGGLLIALVPSPAFIHGRNDTIPYCFTSEVLDRVRAGLRIRLEVRVNPPVIMECWQWDRSVYEDVLTRGGLEHLTWIPHEVSPEGIVRYGEDFWRPFRSNSPFITVTARRRAD